MLFRPKLLILSGPPIAHSATLRSGLASPRRAQSPPSPHTLPAQTNDSQICLHHRHSLTPTKVQTPSTKPEGASLPLSPSRYSPVRTCRLGTAAVITGDGSSSQAGPLPPFVPLSRRPPALQHVSIGCPSDDSPSPGGKPQRQLQATHLHRHLEEVSVCLAPLCPTARPPPPVHLARCRRSILAGLYLVWHGLRRLETPDQFHETQPGSWMRRRPPAVQGLAAAPMPCWAVVMEMR